MNDLFDMVRTLDQYGAYIVIDESIFGTDDKRSKDEKFWIKILAETVSDYLGGLDEKIKFNRENWTDAERWIFHSHPLDDTGFDQKWKDLFPHIGVDVAKRELKERYKERVRRSKNGHKNQGVRGRAKDTVPGGDDPGAGVAEVVETRVGFEYLLFG